MTGAVHDCQARNGRATPLRWTLAGLVQGIAITTLDAPPFVVTLGGMSAFRGAALLYSGGGPISSFDGAYRFRGQGKLGPVPVPVPVPVIVFLGCALLCHLVSRHTRHGRHVYAVGGNVIIALAVAFDRIVKGRRQQQRIRLRPTTRRRGAPPPGAAVRRVRRRRSRRAR